MKQAVAGSPSRKGLGGGGGRRGISWAHTLASRRNSGSSADLYFAAISPVSFCRAATSSLLSTKRCMDWSFLRRGERGDQAPTVEVPTARKTGTERPPLSGGSRRCKQGSR